MQYIGLQSQIWKNNYKSILLLIMFPLVFYALSWLFFYFITETEYRTVESTTQSFLNTIPWITIGVLLWFIIAWFSHTSMIKRATGSRTLERKENKRVYNLVENLCIAAGMKMPKVNVIEDDSLNAFASGISERTYSVSLSRGIIEKLNDDELEGVIAHELTHIRNRDVRLLIISIVFVGIFSFIAETMLRSMVYGGGRRSSSGKKGSGSAQLIGLALALVGLLLATIFRFALSQKREYLADAGGAELTKNPLALASALEKVSQDPTIEAVKRKDVAQMFIENPQLSKKKMSFNMFSSHPPISKRIQILRQF
jgi:heat shock protein HtpX